MADGEPLNRIVTFIAAHYREPLTADQIAEQGGLKSTYAMRLFRARFDTSLMTYVAMHRVANAQRLLLTTNATVLEVLLESGFGSVTQFYKVFKQHCGCSPVEYRQNHWSADRAGG